MSDTRAILEQLVAIDTTSRLSNLSFLEHVEQLLDDHGAVHERVPSPDGTKANLIARIGPDVDGGVALSGHSDCVPVDGQAWSTDPFGIHERDGRLHGRGTCDMKGFLATALAALPAAASADLRRPLQLVLTYDEELGTIGAPAAVRRLLEVGPRPAAVIVGEPTSMEVVTAHKGVRAMTVTVEGLGGHSSQPHRSANAVAATARIATRIDQLAVERRAQDTDPRFVPPYTTFNLATIHGGQAINIVPDRCELTWEYRPVPADDSSAIRDEVERFAVDEVLPLLHEPTGVGTITFRDDASARALDQGEGGAAEQLARELADYGGPARTVPFATDAGHFASAGLSTVVCGPGSIDQAHRPDEWVAVEQLDACERFMAHLVEHLSA